MNQKLALLLAAVMLLATLLSACGGTTADSTPPADEGGQDTAQTEAPEGDQPADSGTSGGVREVVSVAVMDQPNTFHPYNATSTAGDYVFDFIYDRLVYTRADGSFEPRLADSWEMNEDGTVHTFHLNQGVAWHDGTPFTAHDMVYTAQAVTAEDSVVTRRSYFSNLEGTDENGVCSNLEELGVVALDDHTLEFRFKDPIATSTFLSIDAQRYYPMPKHILEDVPFDQLEKHEYWQNPIGTGAFVFESIVPDERIELAANKDYFLGEPTVNKVIIRSFEQANLAAALIAGEVDISLVDMPAADWDLLKSTDGIISEPLPGMNYTYMAVNCSLDYFSDHRIRQAFSMAINREMIVQQGLYGVGQIAVHSLNPENPYFNQAIAGDPYDPDAAKALLEEAGWDFDREITFTSYNTNYHREVATNIIQQNLADIGVKVNIQLVDWATLIDMTREGETELSILGGAGSLDPDDSRVLMQPGGAQNFCNFDDPRYYELAQAGRAAIDPDEKKEIYYEYQQLLHDEPTYVWLYHPQSLSGLRDVFSYVPTEDFVHLNYEAYKWTYK